MRVLTATSAPGTVAEGADAEAWEKESCPSPLPLTLQFLPGEASFLFLFPVQGVFAES